MRCQWSRILQRQLWHFSHMPVHTRVDTTDRSIVYFNLQLWLYSFGQFHRIHVCLSSKCHEKSRAKNIAGVTVSRCQAICTQSAYNVSAILWASYCLCGSAYGTCYSPRTLKQDNRSIYNSEQQSMQCELFGRECVWRQFWGVCESLPISLFRRHYNASLRSSGLAGLWKQSHAHQGSRIGQIYIVVS